MFVRVLVPLKESIHVVLFKKRVESSEKLEIVDSASVKDHVVPSHKKIVSVIRIGELVFDPFESPVRNFWKERIQTF